MSPPIVARVSRSGYSPVHRAISDLGIGPNAGLFNAATVLSGVLLIACAAGFALSMRPVLTSSWRWLGAGLLAFHGLGLAIAGVFTEAPATVAIHWLIGADLGLLGPVVAFLAVGLVWWRNPQWRRWGNYTLITALVTVGVIAFTFWVFDPGSLLASARLGGVMERLLLLTIQSWYVVTGWHLFITAGVQLRSDRGSDEQAAQPGSARAQMRFT